MKIYILPENLEKFKKSMVSMTKHLAEKPSVIYGEPERIRCKEAEIGYDESGRKCLLGYRYYFVTLIEVEIGDIGTDGWVVVAGVYYQENVVTLVSGQYFKNMPSHFGLNYKKCDYCGKGHSNRKESFVIFNPLTNEWKQVGSSCYNKMFRQAKYLANFIERLGRVIDMCGCSEGEFFGGGWKAPDHSKMSAIKLGQFLAVVRDYRKNVNPIWEKSYWENNRKMPGTTDFVNNHFSKMLTENTIVEDPEFEVKVTEFVKGLKEGEFNDNIKKVFADGYCTIYDTCFVFFALKMYDEYLLYGNGDFIGYVGKFGVEVGKKFAVRGQALSWDSYEGFYGKTWECRFRDEVTGLVFVKKTSSPSVLLAYSDNKEKDGTFVFQAKIGRIDVKRKECYFDGMCSKVKK